MKNKYLLLADGNSPHVLKWIKELVNYFDLYLISLNGVSQDVYNYIDGEKIYILNKNAIATGGNYKLIFKLLEIRVIINNINPKYINAHYLSSYGFLAGLSKSSVDDVVLIQSTWGSDILVEPFLNVVRRQIAKYALKKADFVTSDSWYMADIINQLVESKKVLVFPFGFDTIESSVVQKEKLIFSNRALKDFYNIDKIIEWFREQSSEYRLVIANDGVERKLLEDKVVKLGLSERITFVGYLSHAEQNGYYQKAEYYISIPNSDATSVSLLEAMQYGAIPIVSNIPANREWILDGVNGIYFDDNKKLNEMKTEENFAKINQNILKSKALFPKSIKDFVYKVIT